MAFKILKIGSDISKEKLQDLLKSADIVESVALDMFDEKYLGSELGYALRTLEKANEQLTEVLNKMETEGEG